jgi:cytochrome c553
VSPRLVMVLAATLACTWSRGEVTDAERKKAEGACAGCHGAAGAKPTMPGAPRLAGQQYEYLVQTLEALRSGTRESPIMGAMAKPLTDADIRAMARYYSELPGLQTKY